MQFPNPFKKDKPAAPEEARIEPQMSDGEPAPWDMQEAKEEPPAFDVVADERGSEPVAPSVDAVPPAPEAQQAKPVAPETPAEKPSVSRAAPASGFDPAEAPVFGDTGSAPAPAAPRRQQAAADAPAPEKPAGHGLKMPRSTFDFLKKRDASQEPMDEELFKARQRTRYRLVGAAALMVGVIVVAPFLLDKEEQLPQAPVSTEIPAVPEKAQTALSTKPDQGSSGDVDVTASTIEKDTSTAKANLANEARQTAKVEKKPESKNPEPKKPEDEKPVVKKTETAKPAPAAAPKGKGFYVQVMATSSERNADKLVRELTQKGLPAYKMPLEQKAGTIWRVRVGLYKTIDEARSVQGNLVLSGYNNQLMVSSQ